MVLLCVVIALFEETVFRGYLLEGLRREKSATTAIVITGVLFTLAHGQYILAPFSLQTVLATIALFSMATILALSRIVTGSLAFPIAAHFIWDFTALILGHGEELLHIESPWFRTNYEQASHILVGTPSTGGILDTALVAVIGLFVWTRFREHPAMQMTRRSRPGRLKV